MQKSPLGARGERPVHFRCNLPWETVRELTQVPGIAKAPGGLACTWDVAPFLAGWLGMPCPRVPVEINLTAAQLQAELGAMPGLARYKALGFPSKLRDYQKEAVAFLARRDFALLADPMRSGKSLDALAGSVLVGAERTLVVCPSIAKYVWAEQAALWTQSEALILEGRGGDEARRYCLACNARGQVNGQRCEACKKKNGQADGFHLIEPYLWQWGPAGQMTYGCPNHPAPVGAPDSKMLCPGCIAELHAEIERSSFVIVNYDLLVSQKNADAAGATFSREDLQGWAPTLAEHHFDLAILDESHLIRGVSTDQSKRGQTRRERTCQVTEHIDRVWALTGTPIFGFVRDLWGQLDCISKGAVSDSTDRRLWFNFGARYCEGEKDNYGWKWDGRSALADTELVARLSVYKIQRPRSLILSQMPPKNRQVLRIDADKKDLLKKPRGTDDETKLTNLLKQTMEVKLPYVVENGLAEMAEGSKIVVFALLRKNAEALGKAFEAAIKKADVRTKMRDVAAKVWCVHGDTVAQGRFQMAQAFREHTGAGVFIATIDSVQVAVSLKGATSVHFADLHWQPAAMLQAEDRPYEPGTTGLSIIYYVVRSSVDEYIEAVVLPKVITLDRVVAEQGAEELQRAFRGKDKSLKEILEKMMEDVDTSLSAFDD